MSETTEFDDLDVVIRMRTPREPIEEKGLGTLMRLVNLYTEHGWVNIEELMEIQRELLLHLGPVNLDLIIKAAQELKADYDREDPAEEEWRWKGQAEDWF